MFSIPRLRLLLNRGLHYAIFFTGNLILRSCADLAGGNQESNGNFGHTILNSLFASLTLSPPKANHPILPVAPYLMRGLAMASVGSSKRLGVTGRIKAALRQAQHKRF